MSQKRCPLWDKLMLPMFRLTHDSFNYPVAELEDLVVAQNGTLYASGVESFI